VTTAAAQGASVVVMLRRFLVSWIVCACAVALTAGLLPGVHVEGGFGALLLIALVWGLVNGLLGPIARLLSLPLTLMTFGLFALVVNAALFAVTAWIADALSVDSFGWAVLGAFVLSLVNLVLSWLTGKVLTPSRA
jgi:putative membrane protein